MANKNIDDRKKTLDGLQDKIEKKKVRLDQLEQAKSEAREQRMVLENFEAQMDDDAADTLWSEINEVYERVSEEGKELSVEMVEEITELDSLKEETQESLDAAKEAQAAEHQLIESAKANGIIVPESKNIGQNITDNTSLLSDIQKKMQEANEISQKLGML
ncbi:MAG: hypothetical protein IKG82_12260 [Oscillospiraceae bacterium]|nr:hypothetical protein [Oscillospiraceae bacterium]